MQDVVTTQVVLSDPLFHTPFAVIALDGRRIVLDRAVEIGRADSCALVLDDRAASRVHARLEPDGDRVIVIDLGSRNGTFVDGRRTTRAEVTSSAIVRVGDSLVRIAPAHSVPGASEAPLVGGAAIAGVRRTIERVGPTDLPVLVLGETGTGKGIVAHLLHTASNRRGPFVTVNCAAVLDSELFDHARAAGGTVFLDEIGELSLEAQAKLLRVLETKIVDVRFVSTTNRDLHACARAGTYRADLLARLAGVEVRIPALRDRVEDLLGLVRHLWSRATGRRVCVTPNALEALALHSWDHNVRELDHALRAAALIDRDLLAIEALPDAICVRLAEARRSSAVVPRVLHADRRTEIETVLRDTRGNVRRAAHSLGIARGHLYRLLARWELDPAIYRN